MDKKLEKVLKRYIFKRTQERKEMSFEEFDKLIDFEIEDEGHIKWLIREANRKMDNMIALDVRAENRFYDKVIKDDREIILEPEQYQAKFDRDDLFEIDELRKQAYQRDIVENEELLDKYLKFLVERFKDKIKDKYNLTYEYIALNDVYEVGFVFRKNSFDSAIYKIHPLRVTMIKAYEDNWEVLKQECWIDKETKFNPMKHFNMKPEANWEKEDSELNEDEYVH